MSLAIFVLVPSPATTSKGVTECSGSRNMPCIPYLRLCK